MPQNRKISHRQPEAGDRRVVHHSLPDLAYNYIREEILNGRLPFDQPLRQLEIAEQLGVSRLPVREALRRLDAEGFAVLKPRRGYFVAPFDLEEMEDALEVQMLLEERAGYFATMNRRIEDVSTLERALLGLDEIANRIKPDVGRYTKLNTEFHETLFSFSRREYLLRMLKNVSQSVERYTRLGVSLADNLGASTSEHHKIFEAFKKGDAKRVAHFCRVHREKGRQRLIAKIAAIHKQSPNDRAADKSSKSG